MKSDFFSIQLLVGGMPTPLKNMKVSWDDEIPSIWKVIKFMFQTTNQHWVSIPLHPIQSPLNHHETYQFDAETTLFPPPSARRPWWPCHGAARSPPAWRPSAHRSPDAPRLEAKDGDFHGISPRKTSDFHGISPRKTENRWWFPWDLSIKDMWWHGIEWRYPLVI